MVGALGKGSGILPCADAGSLVPFRALEADRYNHITATYFLLAERMLREKQEKQSRSLSLVYNLAREVHSR